MKLTGLIQDKKGNLHALADLYPERARFFALCGSQKFEEALAMCQRKIAESPRAFEGYNDMAFVLGAMGNPSEQLKYKNKAVELAPRNPGLYFSRAMLHYKMANYAAAIPDFTRCAELDRNDQVVGPGNYLYRADCHRRLGNYDAALADCALVPDDFDFPGFLGHFEGTKHHLLAEIERERHTTPRP